MKGISNTMRTIKHDICYCPAIRKYNKTKEKKKVLSHKTHVTFNVRTGKTAVKQNI